MVEVEKKLQTTDVCEQEIFDYYTIICSSNRY